MVALIQPDCENGGLMIRFVDYPFVWLTNRASVKGYLGDLFQELRWQWYQQKCPTDERLDQAWTMICIDAVTRLNSDLYNDFGIAEWEFIPSTSSNDVGTFIHYDYGVPADA